MPPSNNIVSTAQSGSDFSSLVAAILAADPSITAVLRNEDAIYTVFAPTNEAFDGMAAGLGHADAGALLAEKPKEAPSTILLYHVVKAFAFSNDLEDEQDLVTLQD